MENLEHLDLQEQRVRLECLEGEDLLEYQEPRVVKVREEKQEPLDHKDNRDHQEARALQAYPENKERLESLEKVEQMVLLVPGENVVLKENEEPQALLVSQETLAILVCLVLMVNLVNEVCLVHRVRLELQGLRGYQDNKDLWDQLVPREQRVK